MLASLGIVTRRVLFEEGPIDAFQEILCAHAPDWSSNVRVFRSMRRREQVDLSTPGALYSTACEQAESDPLGMVELRGATEALILFLELMRKPVGHTADHCGFGNGLGFQIFRKNVEGLRLGEWCKRMLTAMGQCEGLQVDDGSAELRAESEAKNADRTGGGYRTLTSKNRALPGIYWANFLGQPYCDLIGRAKLLSAPAHEVREVGSGVLVIMSEKPEDWNTPEYKAREQHFLDHVGREYFFERDNPDKPTKSPFNLPELPPHDPSKDIHVLHLGGGKYEVLNPELREAKGLDPLSAEELEKFGLQPDDRGHEG